jgi:hypothetical protein
VRKILRGSKMSDLISFRVLWLRGRKKQRKSMPKELRKLDSRKLKIKKELLLKFNAKESRYSVRCTKLVKMLRLRERREI